MSVYAQRSLLVAEGERLLQTLFNETVADMHVNEPDSRRFDEIAAKAGMGEVGNTSSMAKPALAFKDLAQAGYVEAVKDIDGPLRYRITRLGERYVMQLALSRAETTFREQLGRVRRSAESHQNEERILRERVRVLEGELAQAEQTIDGLLAKPKPWPVRLWRKLTSAGGAS